MSAAINSDLNSKILNVGKWLPVPGAVALIGVTILLAAPAIPALVIGLKVVVITAGAVAAIMALLLLGVAFYKLFSLACEYIDERQKGAEVVNKLIEKRVDLAKAQVDDIAQQIKANDKSNQEKKAQLSEKIHIHTDQEKEFKAQSLQMMRSLQEFEKGEIDLIIEKMRAQDLTLIVSNESYSMALLRLERSLINEYLNAHRLFEPKIIDEMRERSDFNSAKAKGFYAEVERESETSLHDIVESLFVDCFYYKSGQFTVERLTKIKDKLLAMHKKPHDFIYFNLDQNGIISVPDKLQIIPKIDVLLSVIRWKQNEGFFNLNVG